MQKCLGRKWHIFKKKRMKGSVWYVWVFVLNCCCLVYEVLYWVIFRILEHSSHLYYVVTINLGRKWCMTCFRYLLAYSVFNMSIIIILICMWLGITVFVLYSQMAALKIFCLKTPKETGSEKIGIRWKSCIIQLRYFRLFDWKPTSEYPLSKSQTNHFTSLLCSNSARFQLTSVV